MGFSMRAMVEQEAGWGECPECWKKEHGHSCLPVHSCKSVRRASWLPEHVRVAMGQDHSAEQAKLLADAIQKQVGQHRFGDSESEEAKKALDLCRWLRYWSRQGVRVRGG